MKQTIATTLIQSMYATNSLKTKTPSLNQFNCNKCGICCQNISNIEELKQYDKGNGVCINFNVQTKLCTIYENRPDVCNVEKMYNKEFYKYFSKNEYYLLNQAVCKKLQKRKKEA